MTQQRFLVRFVYKAPLVLLAAVGFVYATQLFVNYRSDTTNVTNAAFAIMASLAAIGFSFARVVESEELRNRITFAGERLLHGAILVLVASLLKYLMIGFLALPTVPEWATVRTIMEMTVGVLVALSFSNGVLFAHTGLRVLNDILLLRMTRERDWDNIW
jgi:hypothetical protein